MKRRKILSNVWKLYVIRAAGSFMLIMPVIILFFKENGLDMQDIFILQALFSAVVVIFEIPSGYFSDKIGRKKSLVISHVLGISGYVMYASGSGFWHFLIAELLLGLGASLTSGASAAILYESLLEAGERTVYKRIEGKRNSIGLASEAVASVIGGFMAIISLRMPLYFEVLVLVTTLPVALSLREPKRSMSEKDVLADVSKAFSQLLGKDNNLKWVVIYSSVVTASTLNMVWLIQPYMKEVGVPLEFFGIIWSGLMLSSALVSWHIESLENLFGKNILVYSMILLVVVGYLCVGIAWSMWGVLSLFLFYVARGIHDPIISNHINKRISSDIRVTALSMGGFFARLIFSVTGPMIGWASDTFSLKIAIFYSGGVFASLGLGSLFFLVRKRLL